MNVNDFCWGGIVGSLATSLFYAGIVLWSVLPARKKERS